MLEHIKSFILLLLVGSSLFLTYQLWYGRQPADLVAEDVYERIVVERPRSLEEVVTPRQIVVAGDETTYLYREGEEEFYALWGALTTLLREGEDLLQPRQSADQGDSDTVDHSIIYYFRPLLPAGVALPPASFQPGKGISSITLISQETTHSASRLIVLHDDSGREFALETGEEQADWADRLDKLLEEIFERGGVAHVALSEELIFTALERAVEVRAPIYLPQEPPVMAILALEPESLDREMLLKTFFIDYKMARVIEERDGAVLYTDGNKGVRLTHSGFEYSHPALEEGNASFLYADALLAGSSLISYHGGWPEGLRLQDITLNMRGSSDYYAAGWRNYHQGYPLYTRKATRALFNDRGLHYFSRVIFVLAEEQTSELEADAEAAAEAQANEASGPEVAEDLLPDEPVAGWSKALQTALTIIDAQLPGIRPRLRLEEMTLGYAVTGSVTAPSGEPVWYIRISGEEFYLRVSDLALLSEEEII